MIPDSERIAFLAKVYAWAAAIIVALFCLLALLLRWTDAAAALPVRPEPPARNKVTVPPKLPKPCIGFYVTTDAHGQAVMAERELPAIACLLLPAGGWVIPMRTRQ